MPDPHRPPVYIAAPLSGDVDRNVERAELLAMLASREGLTPVFVHSMVHRGVLGDDNNPADRARGLEMATSLVRLVKMHPAGRIWVLECNAPAEPLSDGVRLEVNVWRGTNGRKRAVHRRGPWASWCAALSAAGLVRSWASLATEVDHRLLVQMRAGNGAAL